MKPGDVVIAAFPGAQITKIRPAVVLSSDTYHRERPDVILGLITSQVPVMTTSTDYWLHDWRSAGLRTPSYFRLYVMTLAQGQVRVIGRLSEEDWKHVIECLRVGMACTGSR